MGSTQKLGLKAVCSQKETPPGKAGFPDRLVNYRRVGFDLMPIWSAKSLPDAIADCNRLCHNEQEASAVCLTWPDAIKMFTE